MDTNKNNGESKADLPLNWTQLGKTEEHRELPIRYPVDVADIPGDETEICIVGTAGQKITVIGADFWKSLNPKISTLILRSHLIRKMNGLEGLEHLELLELYDNQVDELLLSESFATLRTLDMSYNVIRDMDPVHFCTNLQELYLANNKLKKMAGLRTLTKLRKIDLGANRIRVMEVDELAPLVNLEELWLGKNKIEEIQGLDTLTKLRRLDVQSNRLTSVANLSTQAPILEELFLAHNGIDDEGASQPTGLAQEFARLSILDLSRNRLTTTAQFAHLNTLDELWISGNNIESFENVQALAALTNLDTVYLEYNPFQDNDPLYRRRLTELLPNLKQIDATLIGRNPVSQPPEAMDPRRLQEMVISRAKRNET